MFEVDKILLEFGTKDCKQFLYNTVIDECAQELLSIDTLLVRRKYLIYDLTDLSLTHKMAPMHWLLFILAYRQIAKTPKQAIEEKVHLASMKLIFRLKSKEQHYVLSCDLRSTF